MCDRRGGPEEGSSAWSRIRGIRARAPLARLAPALMSAALLALTVPGLRAQGSQTAADQDWCREAMGGHDQARRYCEVRDMSFAAPSGGLDVDARPNGAIEVRAGSGSQVRVLARVMTHARSADAAHDLASRVSVSTEDGRVRATGPDTDGEGDTWWSVSFRITAPASTDLSLRAMNGGITAHGMTGRTRFHTLNGGVHLEDMAGDVSGSTTNGSLHVVLSGKRWAGQGLDAQTTNGGIDLTIPDGYAAHLVTSTVNGGLNVDFPITVQGRIGRELSTDLGGGGPTIRVVTTNGGVDLHRR